MDFLLFKNFLRILNISMNTYYYICIGEVYRQISDVLKNSLCSHDLDLINNKENLGGYCWVFLN